MKSIDNLREWANALHGVYINQIDHTITVTTGWDAPPDMDSVSLRDHVNSILDGIDREVEELRDRDYRNGREDAKGAVEFADRLKVAVDGREDVTLWGVDYTPLPVDADGEPIHVGERVQLIGNDPSTVSHMSLAGDGWRVYVKYDGDLGTGSGEPSRIRHHHAPTVEDVLRELLDALDVDVCLDPDKTIAEYAAKLRLAGEDA